MATNSLIVIGAGIAGLATGCYAQMNGYRSEVVEMHSIPGGVCTSWKRKGYTFDGCIHHLAGCRPGTRVHRIWQELGAMPRPVLFPDDLVRVEAPTGRSLTAFVDLARFEDHLKALAPGDARAIDSYLGAVRAWQRFDLMDLAAAGPSDLARLLAVVLPHLGWAKGTMSDLARRFRDPFLRQVMAMLDYDEPSNPAITHLNMLAQCSVGGFGWPAGGSLAFALDIERHYKALGGRVHYRAEVEEVLVEGERAVGVRLAGGDELRADAVVSTAYLPATLFGLLGGRYVDGRIRAAFARPVDDIGMGLQLSLGVARDLSREPHALVLILPQPVAIADRTYDRLDLELFGFDPSLAPPGKGVIKGMLKTSYRYWKTLYQEEPARYYEEKQRVAEAVLAQLEPRFPGLHAQVEVVDVATPVTTERYTGNAHGYQGGLGLPILPWLAGRGIVRTLPGLEGFYLCGQGAGLPGLPYVAGMGRSLVQHLCRRDGKRFVTATSGDSLA